MSISVETLALAKKYTDESGGGGGGGTSNYNQLSNLPQINGVTLMGNKSLSDIGLSGDLFATFDLTTVNSQSGVSCDTEISDIISAYQAGKNIVFRLMLGTTILYETTNFYISHAQNSSDICKVIFIVANNSQENPPDVVSAMVFQYTSESDKWERIYWNSIQWLLTFDSTPTANSTNPVTSGGIKTAIDNVKSEIDGAMVVVTVSGTTPTITAAAGYQYKCGEVSEISFTPSPTGICDVIFTSGTTAAVLTVPNTVKWAGDFDPNSLETETTYELNVVDGTLGGVLKWQ